MAFSYQVQPGQTVKVNLQVQTTDANGNVVTIDTQEVDVTGVGAPSASHVQNVTGLAGNASSLQMTLAQAVVAGDVLIAFVRNGGGAVSDNINGAWTPLQTDGVVDKQIVWMPNSKAASAGGLVITVAAPAGSNIRASADVFRAYASPSFAGGSAAGWSGTAIAAGTTPSVAAGCLIYAGAAAGGAFTVTPGTSAGVSLVLGGQQTDANIGTVFTEYALVGAAGAQNATATASVSAGGEAIQVAINP